MSDEFENTIETEDNVAVTLTFAANLEDLKLALLDSLSDQQLFDFIVSLDELKADWDFTESLYEYFSDEMKSIDDVDLSVEKE